MKYYLPLFLLAALWGASFLFLRVASPEFGPIPLIFVRTALAALVLIPLLSKFRFLLLQWRSFIFVGTFSTAVPFCLFAYASLYLPAGLMSVLNATVPLFSALLSAALLLERFTLWKVCGLLMGFVGVLALSSGESLTMQDAGTMSVIAALIAAMLYAISSIFVKLKMQNLTPIEVTMGCQLYSTVLLMPFAYWLWPEAAISPLAWVNACLLAVFSTALALILFFRLLKYHGVTPTLYVTYLIPLFGIGWGALFLAEEIQLSMLVGGGLILLGVGLTKKN